MNTANSPEHAPLKDAKSLMQQGAFEDAKSILVDEVESRDEDAEALYMLAVCERYLERYEAAQSYLDRLIRLRPRYGRAYQESGHLRRAMGQNERALADYRKAVDFNSALLASWSAIRELAGDDRTLANQAREQIQRLSALPKELLSVRSMISEGALLKAERLCRAFMQKNPKHVEGMRLLADLAVRFDVLDDAEFLLESALEFEPENRFARFDYVNVLYRRQKYEQSLSEAEALLEKYPDNDSYRSAYANQCVAVGRYDEAVAIYNDLLARNPGADLLHLLKGHALKTTGDLEGAIDSYRAAYGARPDFGDAYWSLANLKTYSFDAEEIAALEKRVIDESVEANDRVHMHFALGKAFEDQDSFETAFDHYELGNTLKRDLLAYDADRMSTTLGLQESVCTRQFFDDRKDWGAKAPDPIFIVGLPRAGSTLLEQILASHSLVDGTFELPNIGALAHRLDGRRTRDQEPNYPKRLLDLNEDQVRQAGEQYLQDTKIHRSDAPLFIDKMPNNFRHIGMIHAILPNAKIIDARRHPMACCFSGFKQLFASGQEFTYGLREIGQYYSDYVRLMDHWNAVLPNRVLRVNYESVVGNLENEVRRILDYCGLEFEDACVEFHRTERSIRTPSAEQVRQPIYTSGLLQWQNFEPWLAPLKQALGDNVERYDREIATEAS